MTMRPWSWPSSDNALNPKLRRRQDALVQVEDVVRIVLDLEIAKPLQVGAVDGAHVLGWLVVVEVIHVASVGEVRLLAAYVLRAQATQGSVGSMASMRLTSGTRPVHAPRVGSVEVRWEEHHAEPRPEAQP
jgi:hypothetical protein